MRTDATTKYKDRVAAAVVMVGCGRHTCSSKVGMGCSNESITSVVNL